MLLCPCTKLTCRETGNRFKALRQFPSNNDTPLRFQSRTEILQQINHAMRRLVEHKGCFVLGEFCQSRTACFGLRRHKTHKMETRTKKPGRRERSHDGARPRNRNDAQSRFVHGVDDASPRIRNSRRSRIRYKRNFFAARKPRHNLLCAHTFVMLTHGKQLRRQAESVQKFPRFPGIFRGYRIYS